MALILLKILHRNEEVYLQKKSNYLLIRKNNNNNKITTNPFIYIYIYIYIYIFALFHESIVITVTFKMLHTFLLKRQSKRYTIMKFCHSNNSDGKDLAVLLKIGLSRDISKLSLISKLILLYSLDKMMKSSKLML